MAAAPVGVLVSMGLPRASEVDAEEVHAGVREAASSVGAAVLGGDVSSSPGPLVLDLVVVGRADAPCLRAGAQPGDDLWVTGELGASAAAVRLLERGEAPSAPLRRAFARPTPRVREASVLAATGGLHALVDLSDGLAGDAGHLAAAGDVRIVVEVVRIPVASQARTALGEVEALACALHGGEDYELCFAAARGALDGLAPGELMGVGLTRVGRVEEGAGLWLESPDGWVRPFERGGYDHLGGGSA